MIDPKSASGYRLGIVNPLTLVGMEIQSILRERSFPFAKVVLLDSTGQATGALTEIADEPAVVLAVSDDELEDCDVVFFCGPADGNQEWIQRFDEDNFVAIDLNMHDDRIRLLNLSDLSQLNAIAESGGKVGAEGIVAQVSRC